MDFRGDSQSDETACAASLFQFYRSIHTLKKLSKEVAALGSPVRPEDGRHVLSDSISQVRVRAADLLNGNMECLPGLDPLVQRVYTLTEAWDDPTESVVKVADLWLATIDEYMQALADV